VTRDVLNDAVRGVSAANERARSGGEYRRPAAARLSSCRGSHDRHRSVGRALVAAVILLAATPAAAQPAWPDVVDRLRASVLLLEGDGACSAIVINAARGYLLTAAHCAPEKQDLTVGERDASVLKINRKLDLAVLKTRLRQGVTDVSFAPTMPRAGSAVAVVGFPFGARSLTVQIGIVANPDVEGRAWVDADLLPGDSGGAIVDAEGRLVGVSSAFRYYLAADVGVAVPLPTVLAFVEDYLPGADE